MNGDPAIWTDVQNLKVMAWDNFQTGWWIRDDNTSEVGIYTETDKPINNKCINSDDCGSSECCATWPDSNSRRCVGSQFGGVEQVMEPFSNWTPLCYAGVAPVPAEQDLEEEALA